MADLLASNSVSSSLRSLARLIGNTPLLGIHYRLRGSERVVYAKCEHLNFTGSIKDRMALHILRDAHQRGLIRPGDTIAEATSGNTGISFAAIGRLLGHPVKIFMPDWMSQERKALILGFGAEIVPVSKDQGGFLGSIRLAEEFSRTNPNVFLPRQFSNQANAAAHECTTGPELAAQLASTDLRPRAFVAGVGTGGTVMGVGRFLRSRDRSIKVHPVEPAESPTLSTGHKVGHHRIQGISDEFIPAIVDLTALDDVISVPDGDSILMAQKLATNLGLGVGISSGCNFLAAVRAQERYGAHAPVVTVFADDNKKYLTTDLMHHEPTRNDYLAPEIELLGLTTSQRVCEFCESAAHCH